MRRKKKSENNGFNVWRSYSDMMAGVLLLFVLIMCVTLFQAQKSYNESIQERDDKIALQEEYTQQLLDKQTASMRRKERSRIRTNSSRARMNSSRHSRKNWMSSSNS